MAGVFDSGNGGNVLTNPVDKLHDILLDVSLFHPDMVTDNMG